MEGHLAGPSAEATGGNGTNGDGNGGNPTFPPFVPPSGGNAKANSRVFFDDETEE